MIAALLTAGLLYWCVKQVDLKSFLESLEHANLWWLVPASLCTVSILFLNSIQLKKFLPRYDQVSFKKMFQMVAVFSMMVNVVPFWGGHALLIYLLGEKEKVGKTVALSVVTLDQIIEGFAKIFIFAVVVFSGPFPEWMKGGMQGFLILVALAYTVIFFLSFRFRNHFEDLHLERLHLGKKIYNVFKKWAYHLHVLRDWRSLGLTVGLAILMKFMEVLAVYFIQISLGIELGLLAAFLVVAALSLATVLPLTPGRLGLFEAGALLTYQYLGVPAAQALALGVLIHIVHTLPFIVIGYLASIKMGFQKMIPVVPSEDSAVLASGGQ